MDLLPTKVVSGCLKLSWAEGTAMHLSAHQPTAASLCNLEEAISLEEHTEPYPRFHFLFIMFFFSSVT